MAVEALQAAPKRGDGADGETAEKAVDPGWAWAPYEPDARRPWDLSQAGHLYRRAAFGASWSDLERALAEGPERSISRLLSPGADADAFNHAQDGYEASAGNSEEGLRAWWLRRMLHTPHPLLEKMTLFWRSFFSIGSDRVKNPLLLRRHVELLRKHALGDLAALLQGIASDPAMLLGLDSGSNRKGRPTDSFARKLLECTLGGGRFSEKDIQEAARAFTGWFVLSGELRFFPREHDTGVKRILGQEGNFTGEDVVRIVLREPDTARSVVRRLYRWLISETGEPLGDLVAPLAESFGATRDIGKLVERMLRSNLFFSREAYRRRVKGPVEFALGIVKALEGDIATGPLGGDLCALGQDLCQPPTVKGWEGGASWINWSTITGRSNLARALLLGEDPYGDKLDPLAVARKRGHGDPGSAERFFIDLFFQGDLEDEVRRILCEAAASSGDAALAEASQRLRRFIHLVVTSPEFHLA